MQALGVAVSVGKVNNRVAFDKAYWQVKAQAFIMVSWLLGILKVTLDFNFILECIKYK